MLEDVACSPPPWKSLFAQRIQVPCRVHVVIHDSSFLTYFWRRTEPPSSELDIMVEIVPSRLSNLESRNLRLYVRSMMQLDTMDELKKHIKVHLRSWNTWRSSSRQRQEKALSHVVCWSYLEILMWFWDKYQEHWYSISSKQRIPLTTKSRL